MSSGASYPGVTFSSELQDGSKLGQVTYKEFLYLCAQLEALFRAAGINADGTFDNLVTNNITIIEGGTVNSGPPTTPGYDGGGTGSGAGAGGTGTGPFSFIAAGDDTEVQINVEGKLGAFSGLRWIYSGDPIATPSAASASNTGSGAYASTPRYYKTQMVEATSGIVTRASELGASVMFTPSGLGSAARITRPPIQQDATHWIVWASADGISFVNISGLIAIASTVYDDSVDPSSYAGASPASTYSDAAQLRVAGRSSDDTDAVVILSGDSQSNSASVYVSGDGYADLKFGIEYTPFNEIARSDSPVRITAQTDAFAFTQYYDETPGSSLVGSKWASFGMAYTGGQHTAFLDSDDHQIDLAIAGFDLSGSDGADYPNSVHVSIIDSVTAARALGILLGDVNRVIRFDGVGSTVTYT